MFFQWLKRAKPHANFLAARRGGSPARPGGAPVDCSHYGAGGASWDGFPAASEFGQMQDWSLFPMQGMYPLQVEDDPRWYNGAYPYDGAGAVAWTAWETDHPETYTPKGDEDTGRGQEEQGAAGAGTPVPAADDAAAGAGTPVPAADDASADDGTKSAGGLKEDCPVS